MVSCVEDDQQEHGVRQGDLAQGTQCNKQAGREGEEEVRRPPAIPPPHNQ